MLNIKKLQGRPQAFRRLCGLSPGQFQHLLSQLEPRWALAQYKRQAWLGRQRKVGGGRARKLSLDQSLLMLLLYYRTYANHLFMGMVMGLDDSNVGRYFKRLEPVLAQVFKIPQRTVVLLPDEIWTLIVDATEQETQRRPGTGYSGKKKRQTLKTQVVVNQQGVVKTVSASMAGQVHDKKLFDQTRLYIRTPTGPRRVKFKADLGYLGTTGDLPIRKPLNRPLMMHERYFNRQHAKVRIVVEHVFAHLKQFRILQDRYRNPVNRYNLTFRNVCGLRNLVASPS